MLRRLLIIGILILIGCSAKDPLSPEVQSGKLMPLAVGNVWVYGYLLYSPPNLVPTDTALLAIQILDSTLVNNDIWYRGRNIYFNPPSPNDTTYYYYANRQNGVWIRESLVDSAHLSMRYPAAVGLQFDSWYVLFGAFAGIVPVTVTSTNETIMTPVDTLICHEYRLMVGDPDYIYNDYYNPKYGHFASHWELSISDVWYPLLDIELWAANLGGGAPSPPIPVVLEQFMSEL